MKNLITVLLALAIAVFVYFQSDSTEELSPETNTAQPSDSGDGGATSKTPATPAEQPGQRPKEESGNPPNFPPPGRSETPTEKPTENTAKAPASTPAPSAPQSVLVTLPSGEKVDVGATLDRIHKGIKHPHRNDGSVFGNYERLLPRKQRGYYREYVHPTPGKRGPGARRIVKGQRGEIYYTHDHYKSFVKVDVQ